jgi:hypothetical protein
VQHYDTAELLRSVIPVFSSLCSGLVELGVIMPAVSGSSLAPIWLELAEKNQHLADSLLVIRMDYERAKELIEQLKIETEKLESARTP